MIWFLYLAVTVAAVIGQEKPDTDPLRYNPHERVYNFDGHDKRQHEILQEVNSPDYLQPTLILDYRYMKTGGREYLQGPGGQYIILPHGVKSPQHTKFRNFDELLENLQNRQHNKEYIRTENYERYDHRYYDRIHDDRRHDDRRHDDRYHGDHHHDDHHHDLHRYDDNRNRKGLL